MKNTPYKAKMWAIMRDGETYMIISDIDAAETHLGLWSKNGFSKHHWNIQPVDVRFPHETSAERKKRQSRHVQAVVELNYALSQ